MKDTYEELYELGEFLGNEEMMERYDKKYSKVVGKEQSRLIRNILLLMIVVTLISPFIINWVTQ